jgi:hypothetical protein
MNHQNCGARGLQLDSFGTGAMPDQQKKNGENHQKDRDPEKKAANFLRVKRWHGSNSGLWVGCPGGDGKDRTTSLFCI